MFDINEFQNCKNLDYSSFAIRNGYSDCGLVIEFGVIRMVSSDPDIIKTIKISKLRWTEHVMRMPEENPVKKLTLLRTEGSGGGPQDPWY